MSISKPTSRAGVSLDRRRVLGVTAGLMTLGSSAFAYSHSPASSATRELPLTYPARLAAGDLISLVNPASARHEIMPTEIMAESIEALGLRTRRSTNYYARNGHLAGTDEQRVADIHASFADPEVKGIWATGGWGSARLLPKIDFDLIRRNPKVVVGYSDATALLNAIHARTGLITFHGPFPRSRVSAYYQRRLLMAGGDELLRNPQTVRDNETVVTRNRIRTLRGGEARGRLIGGNLTVLSAIVGSEYLPDFDGAILFLEDVNEAIYRVDRMLTQLKLVGILDRIGGFVFGNCTECNPNSGYASLTLEEVLRDHIEPLKIPAWMGAFIGHIPEQFTLPIGQPATINADRGEIRFSSAVG